MQPLKFIWATFFRLFPCPTPVGLQRIGNPGRKSPVLVTCNFYLTVRRLTKALKGIDAWLLVADSGGVNVWCAAGANVFNTRSVVSAAKISGIAEMVNHRRLILPPLGAPGIRAKDVKDQSGWTVHWGPVRARDIPRYLQEKKYRVEEMKRVTYNWQERLDTALGALFPFFFLGAIGFLIFGRHLLLNYMLVGMVVFLFFYLSCPWLPGKHGLTKVILPGIILGVFLFAFEMLDVRSTYSLRADMTIAMVMLLIYGTELGGIASTMRSDLDPFLSRLGIGSIGNLSFAGSVRTELLNKSRQLRYYRECCIGCRSCADLCPQGVWEIDAEKRAIPAYFEKCTACRACLVQCNGGAIKAEPVK
ncbi:MAG: hypothetical protein JSU83_21910 [Deltaproteobacteria bacterium]|nr:MAG: hypothetical protein JSU83_21910 [Deltaproteobacteria bacterium]